MQLSDVWKKIGAAGLKPSLGARLRKTVRRVRRRQDHLFLVLTLIIGAVAGLTVGLLGYFVPEVLGVGYMRVGDALNGNMVIQAMALLVVLKFIATATCYGSGNAGGIFGPSLFIGAMLVSRLDVKQLEGIIGLQDVMRVYGLRKDQSKSQSEESAE